MIGYIYLTTNLKTGKIYVGQHLAEHFEPDKYIGSGCILQEVIKRDGKANFKCELLQECDTIDELNTAEKFYIKLYNTQDRSIGYNIADGGDDPWNRGKKMHQQYCQKDSAAQRRIAPNISCFDLQTGELIKVFNSCYDAAEFLNLTISTKISSSRIHTVCKTKKGHAYGYIWRFESEYKNITKLDSIEVELEHSNPRAKPIVQLTKDGIFINEFESAAAYSKTISNDYATQRHIAKNINGVCTGDAKTYHGYIWKYKN